MPTPTYIPLANITLGSAASTVTFTSINQTYRDLILVATGNVTSSNNAGFRLNNDSGANYEFDSLNGDGFSSYGNGGESTAISMGINAWNTTAENQRTISIVHFMDYTQAKRKMVLMRTDRPNNYVELRSACWKNNAAISTITVLPFGGTTFTATSTFALYGVTA